MKWKHCAKPGRGFEKRVALAFQKGPESLCLGRYAAKRPRPGWTHRRGGLRYQLLPLLGPGLVLGCRVPASSQWTVDTCDRSSPLTPAFLSRWTSPAWAYPQGTIT